MFEYSPGNYVWNLGVVATLNSGGLIDEVDRAYRPIKDAAQQGEDAGTSDFLRAWTALTDQLVGQAEDAEKGRPHPHRRSALLPRDQLPVPGRADAVEVRPVRRTTTVVHSLTVPDRQDVDDLVGKAIAAGGRTSLHVVN